MLDRLEALLCEAARTRSTLTYQQVAMGLSLSPPHTIHQATELIEALMRRQADRGEAQLASLVVGRGRGGLPAPGFFLLLRELGLYAGAPDGQEARDFHEVLLQRCFEAVNAAHRD